MKTSPSRLISASLALLALLAFSDRLHAANATWTGASDGVWNNAGNWSPSIPGTPGGNATDVATFNNTANTSITVDGNRTVGSILFDTGAGAFRFSGGPLVINGGAAAGAITLNATDTKSQVFDTSISLSTNQNNFSFLNSSTTSGVVFVLNGNLAARTNTGTINFSGAGGGFIVRGNITDNGAGVTSISKDSNTNTLILRGSNTFTGTSGNTRGVTFFDSIANVGGGASSFGAPTTAANGTITVGSSTTPVDSTLVYTGSGSTTDRKLDIGGATGVMSANLATYGTGALVWNGSITSSGNATNTHTITLAGANTQENRVGGVVSNSTGGAATSLLKSGSGTWNLTGNNTYTGTTSVAEGLLRLDFSNASAPATNIISSSSALALKGGTLALRGKTTGDSSQTVAGLTLSSGYSKILADGNGGNSTTLTLGAITRSGVGATLDVSLASTGAVTTSTSTVTNSVITDAGGVAYATVNGSDWATYNAGNIQALGSYQTATDPTTWAAADNVSLSGNPSANVTTRSINTLRFTAASTVAITAANTLTVGTGGILITGNGSALISGGTLKGSGGTTKELVVFQNKSSGTAEISSVIADNTAATAFTKAGDGTLTLSGTNTYTGNTVISGGVLKVAGVGNYANRGLVFSGGVLGLSGGNLTGLTLGTGAANRVSWTNSGGFAAYGADRTVAFTTAPIWGATANFLSDKDALILGASDADAKIIWSSDIVVQPTGSVSAAPKQIRVVKGSGSAAVDAEISGVLSNNLSTGGIVKTGTGTLLLSNTNTYGGVTIISAGTLIVSGSIGNSMLTTVSSGATLAGSGTTAQIELMSGGTVTPGNSAGTASIGTLSTSQNGNSDLVWNGEASSIAQMKFDLSNTDSTSDLLSLGAGKFDKGTGSYFKFDFLGTGGANKTYTLINFGLTDFSVGDFSYSNLTSGLTGNFTLTGSSLQFTTVPEPSTWGLLAFSLTTVVVLRRRSRA